MYLISLNITATKGLYSICLELTGNMYNREHYQMIYAAIFYSVHDLYFESKNTFPDYYKANIEYLFSIGNLLFIVHFFADDKNLHLCHWKRIISQYLSYIDNTNCGHSVWRAVINRCKNLNLYYYVLNCSLWFFEVIWCINRFDFSFINYIVDILTEVIWSIFKKYCYRNFNLFFDAICCIYEIKFSFLNYIGQNHSQ